MKKAFFGDWVANVADVVREKMRIELHELSTYGEVEARMYWKEGYTPKRFFKEVLDQTEVEKDDFDMRFDL